MVNNRYNVHYCERYFNLGDTGARLSFTRKSQPIAGPRPVGSAVPHTYVASRGSSLILNRLPIGRGRRCLCSGERCISKASDARKPFVTREASSPQAKSFRRTDTRKHRTSGGLYIEPGSDSVAARRLRTLFWTSARYCLACSRVLIERNRSRMTALCPGDISRSWCSAEWRIPGNVPWLTVSSGLAAAIVLKSGTLIFITGRPIVAAGDGSALGVSGLGALKERSASRRFALASRCVRGLIPNKASAVAGIEAWSYNRWSITFFGTSGEMTTAGTRGPYCWNVKPF
jgi:hypothetical protein